MSDVKPPWEIAEETKAVDTPPAASAPASSGESWMDSAGTGFEDGDMEGDPRPNPSANVRFWMPKKSERTIIFVTDGPQSKVLWEHSGQLNGHYRNYATCLEHIGQPCPLCQYANANGGKWRRSKVRYFTIIDCSEFTDRAGRKRKNERRLLVAKKDVSEILSRKYLSRKDAGDSFRGAMFKVYRPNDPKSAGTGEDFEFIKMVDLNEYPFKDDINYSSDPAESKILPDGQLDLAKLVKPDPKAIKAIVDQLTAGGGGGADAAFGGGSEGTDHTVAF